MENVNEIHTIEDDTESIDEKPIMDLFKRLISNDNKQNTVLTNSQIIKILEKEFDLTISELHDLEVDIYLSVMKRFLKDWPLWDEFDKTINNLKSIGDTEGLNKILQEKYYCLRNYLKMMLDASKVGAKEVVDRVSKINTVNKTQKTESESNNDVILEVQCSREQLNSLIFRHPHPKLNGTVFNISEGGPSRITVKNPSPEAMVNWLDLFRVNVNLPYISYKREMDPELKHILVNKKLNIQPEIIELKTCFEEKVALKKCKKVPKTQILESLDTNLKYWRSSYQILHVAKFLFNLMINDLKFAPENLKIPGAYRRYMNKYQYVRYLYTDVDVEDHNVTQKYDLQLEETLSPRYQFTITKWDKQHSGSTYLTTETFLTMNIYFECKICSTKFSGVNILKDLESHFLEIHYLHEKDWTCTNCKKTFSMSYLAEKYWYHKC